MKVFVASDQDRSNVRVQMVVSQAGHDCPAENMTRLDLALSQVAHTSPDLAIVVLSEDTNKGLSVMTQMRLVSKARLLVIGPVNNPQIMLQALRMGANDYVDESKLEDDLNAALARMQADASRGETGSIIAILGASGGCGSSTIAANIATVLAKNHKKALLVDMKLETGDLAALLDLHPEHTLADVCQSITRMDRLMFESSLTKHSSGVHLLAPPQNFAQIRDVTPDGVRHTLTLAKSLFPYIVIDLDHSYREEQLQALRAADTILLVFRLDFASLRNTNRTLEYLTQLGIRRDRIKVVVNRYGQPQEVPAAKAEEALGLKIFHYVPEDAKTVNLSNNNGVPAVIDYPTAKLGKSLIQLAVSVNGKKH